MVTGDHRYKAAVDAHAPLAIAGLVSEGFGIVVATRDANLRPYLGRGWGATPQAPGLLHLCVDASEGSPLRVALAERREIAVTFAQPSTYRSLQVKGVVKGLADATPDQLTLVDRHKTAFGVDAAHIGVAPRMIARMLDQATLIAVTLTIEEVYDQTPGAAAGHRL